jgi:hypothetical protein
MFRSQIADTAAWDKVKKFVQFVVLREGQLALSSPETAESRGHFVQGVQYILAIVEGTVNDLEVVDSNADEDNDDDILALTLGSSTDSL